MVNESRLEEFLWFICERQRIWERRFVEQQDPPWTDDPVLQSYHFCNVYRDLDKGTIYVKENILPHNNPEDVLLNVVVYRLLNKPESYEIIGGYTPVDEFDVDDVVQKLELWGEENTVFNSAYRIPGQRFVGSDSKIENVFYGIVRDDLLEFIEDYTNGVIHADSLRVAHRTLTHLRGIGDFLAYELVTDLNYSLLDFAENDFVNVGPGAERGIELIWPTVEHYVDKIRYIVSYQEAMFEYYDLEFPYWEEKPQLTMRDVEHSMCEFSKFWRVKHQGGSTRLYEPPSNGNQWEMGDFV